MKTKVLVTGANSQLAKTIKELYNKNADNVIFDFASKNELDISDKDSLTLYFSTHNFNYCINCAAYTNVEEAETNRDLAFKINSEGVKNLAEVCKLNSAILIHISTDFVFDGKKQIPYVEEDSTNPLNVYGASKLAGEKHVEAILPSHFIIRTSWLYSTHGKNFVKTIISKIKEKKKLQIVTTQIGTPTSCLDLSEFIYFLIKSKTQKFGLYNFSALGQASWYEFAKQIQTRLNDTKSEITPTDSFPSKVIRPNYSVLNNNKAKKIVTVIPDWKASVDKVVFKLKDAKH